MKTIYLQESYTPDFFHELIMVDETSRCGSGGFMWGVAGGFAIGSARSPAAALLKKAEILES